MASRSVYEVMVQQGGHWVVQTTTETQADALRLAERMVTTGTHDDVRVLQSFYDGKKRTLVENELKRFRRKSGPKAAEAAGKGPLSGRLCNTHLDFYRLESRRMIRVAMMEDLERWVLTPLELLHSLPHVQKMHASGKGMQGAVQRVAVVQSRETNQSIHQRMKVLFEFCTEIEREMRLIWKNGPIPAVPPGGLQARLAELKGTRNGDFLLYAGIAESLKEAKDWPSKLSALYDLLSPEPSDAELALFDEFAAEILESGPAVKALLGEIDDRGAAIMALLDIQAGLMPEEAQKVHPFVERLVGLFRSGRLPECRASFYSRIKQELESLRSVSGNANDLVGETRVLKILYEKLARDARERADARDLMGTLEGRSSNILLGEILGAKLQAQRTTLGQIDLLLRLAPGILGASNRRKMATFIIGLTENEENRNSLLGGENIVEARMKQFRKWEDNVRAAGFDRKTEEELVTVFDNLCVAAMRKAQFFSRLQREEPVPSVRALRLMELAAGDGVTTGLARKAVQAEMIRLLKDPPTIAALAESAKNDPELTARLRDAYNLLSQQAASA